MGEFSWKVVGYIFLASVFGTLAIIPYAFSLVGLEISPILVGLQVLQSSVISLIAIVIGLKLAARTGLKLDIIRSFASDGRKACGQFSKILKPSLAFGALAGVLIIVLDLLFQFFGSGIALGKSESVMVFYGFLASFYGGINEEILLRLFFMSLLVWITWKVRKTKDGKPTSIGVWLSIIVAAVIFGLGHLPITSALTQITPLVIARAVVLNGIGGIIFGWLYWKKGLESAMVAHFTGDIVLHVLFPALFLFI